MEKFTRLTATAIPFDRANVDTDLIIPAAYLKTTSREGLGKGAFAALRYRPDGSRDEACVFNDPTYKGAKILITGENFGCGSSREHAAWALTDIGLKAVIAPSFADIFASNAFKNGLLTITLDRDKVALLLADAAAGRAITIDLAAQTISRPNHQVIGFDYDPFKRYCLLNGLDEIGITLQSAAKIAAFEARRKARLPWL
ncbi:MAG: 3-isopropylmalate dehydratase small subunit [Pseudomonadota bacterium]|jgi:3-isopropylmalate/(R)-2-methylmalate dehydratase small subunit